MSNKTMDSKDIRRRVQGSGQAARSLVSAFPTSLEEEQPREREQVLEPATQLGETLLVSETHTSTSRGSVTLDLEVVKKSGYTKPEKYLDTRTPRTYYVDNALLEDMKAVTSALEVDYSRFVNDAIRYYIKHLTGD